jgi:hypothetical protein
VRAAAGVRLVEQAAEDQAAESTGRRAEGASFHSDWPNFLDRAEESLA